MNRIAGRLGMTGPALAHRFGNKRNLMLAFARRQPAATAELFDKHRQLHVDRHEAIISAYVALASNIGTREALSNNLAMLHLDLTDPEFGEQATLQARTLKDLTAGLLLEAQPDLSAKVAEEIAHEIYVNWNGAVLAWAIDGSGPLAGWIERQLRQTIAWRFDER